MLVQFATIALIASALLQDPRMFVASLAGLAGAFYV
jgi:hypothetical protein